MGFEPVEARVMPVRLKDALALAAAVLAGCAGGAPGGDPRRDDRERLAVDTAGWKTDFSRHSVPLSEFMRGGPPRDGIPPIDEPKAVSRREAEEFLGAREPVLAVAAGGEARAYPIQILVWHEIANDVLGGRPIAVTYCPLCNSALVFDRRLGRRTLTFGTTGNLRKSDLVMWDRQTESWWQQLTAEAVVGKLTGQRLTVLPSQTLSWADFKRLYPDGDVLSRDTGAERDYSRNPYEGYDQPASEPAHFGEQPDDRLPPKERVAAVFVGKEALVVPFSRLERERVANEQLGGVPVVVLFKKGVLSPLDASAIEDSRDVGTAAAFERRVDDRRLEFEPRAGGGFTDRQTGSSWDITGRAVGGRLRGERLAPLRQDQQFWFALAAFVPGARVAD
jgi:hypothetical protein